MATTDYVKYGTTLELAKTMFDDAEGKKYESDRRAEAIAIMLMLGTGYRISDAVDLKWSQIDWRGRQPEGYAMPLPSIKKKLIKTNADHEAVIYDAEISSRLKAYSEWLKLTYGKTGVYVLENMKTKKVYSRMWIMRRLRQHNKAGRLGWVVETVGAHSLRKAFAMDLFDRTGKINIVQKALGHSNIVTTSAYLKQSDKEFHEQMALAYKVNS